MADEVRYCIQCGGALPSGAEFCPRCGTRVVALPPQPAAPVRPAGAAMPSAAVPPRLRAATPARKTHLGLLIGIAVALLAVGLALYAVLAGMPYSEQKKPAGLQQPNVVTEQEPRATTTISEIGDPAEPPQQTATVIGTVPPAETQQPAAPAREITEREAMNVLRGYVTSRNYYDVSPECVSVDKLRYENGGYTIEVNDSCSGSRLLGVWRVDSKTREVYRQREDGRFLKP